MNVLNFIAGIAAIILGLELVIACLLAAALCGGIWFGLRFAEKKAMPLFDKVNGYMAKGRQIERMSLSYAVKPFIMAHALGAQIGITASTLAERTRDRSASNRG